MSSDDASSSDWDVAFLSDRDVSGQVPVNYVPHPGVYLTPACFPSGTYDDQAFKSCFSNLLNSEIRRFMFDLYWDTLNRKFRLCPVELPLPADNTTDEADHTGPKITARQVITQNATVTASSVQSNITNSTITTTSAASIPTSTTSSGKILYQLGPYSCTNNLDLSTIFSVLKQYTSNTSLLVDARLQYMIFNLRAASTFEAPTVPRQTLNQTELPNSDELINNSLDQTGSMLYTPFLLYNDRKNLNSSWFQRRLQRNFPLLNYFTTNRLPSGDISTPDGWPCENYLQLERGYRLLIGYGSIDAQMSGYNFAGDGSTIFPPGYMTLDQTVTLSGSGDPTSGCFYSNTNNQISQVNSSWAVSTVVNLGQTVLDYAADNLTMCGISPILNSTLDDEAADVNYRPYQTFGSAALFSWAAGEPQNATAAGEATESAQWRCALMVSNDDFRGHWRVEDCQKKYRVACREANLPYVWTLSTNAVSYSAGEEACKGNTTFDVPRVGLENLYLDQHVRAISDSQRDSSLLNGIWINFNSLDTEDCWVTSGLNGSCPYTVDEDTVRQRTILVPTIASFITLVITALTILVKCNGNRRKSKTRKRGEGGWDYEGVPS